MNTSYRSNTAYACELLMPGKTNLISIFGYNKGAAKYLQIHESATRPANTAVPVSVFEIPTGNFSLDLFPQGLPLANCALVASSTVATLTVDTTADLFMTAVFGGR